MTETRFLNAREVREALGISTATYYRWLRSGRLTGVRVGRTWRFAKEHVDELLGQVDPAVAARREDLEAALLALGAGDTDAAEPVGEIVRLLMERVLRRLGTDLHLVPVADGLQIRERIDGALRAVEPPLPEGARVPVVTAVKRRAGLEADASDRPQVGRFFFPFEGRKVDVRASTYPTGLGESLTLRLLDPAAVTVELTATGFREAIVRDLRKIMRRRKGVFIVNGPTATGKSTTLYCMLRELASPGRKVMTVEDPVELHLDGLLQANVGPGMSFLDAMKAMLRADLDVGMVSEMRDADSMQLLFQMANTGHLMLTALHAPDAVSCLHRLLRIGRVEPRLVVENLLGILDQRLLGRCCLHCRKTRRIRGEDADRLGLAGAERRRSVAYAEGCEQCDKTGVAGRTVAGELLALTPALCRAVEDGRSSPEELEELLPADAFRLRDDVLWRLFAKEISPDTAAKALGL